MGVRGNAQQPSMAIAPHDVLTLLAAGGRSSRFGQDKASYVWAGRTLLERGLETVGGISAEIAVGLPPSHEEEPAPWGALRATLRVIEDEPPGIGPMGSLLAALRSARQPWVLFLAVDLPLLETAHLRRLLDAGGGGAAAATPLAIVATREGRIQPTCALYHTALLPNVEQAVRNREYALRAIIEDAPHVLVPLPDRALTNVNRLEDLPQPE